ncbi:MAG: alpha/beta hydrolase [Ekhidna sp.]|nr:alpha/beta hydrolase [Ekhidna sp.]
MSGRNGVFVLLLLLAVNSIYAQRKPLPEPDLPNISYGSHERQVFDIWFADSSKVTPLAIYIHGGGFVSGDKRRLNQWTLNELLIAGISVAAVNYRFIDHAPLPAAHRDVLRAVQTIRSMSKDWKIDKTKIAVFGGSAGAQLSMWLAFSDEMANPKSNNPVERESSRLTCVATSGGQTTMHMEQWRSWISEFVKYGTTQDEFYGRQNKKERKKTIESISAYSIISSDDPPIYMKYGMPPEEAVPEKPKKVQGWKVHHVNFGIKLKERMDSLGVEAHLKYPQASVEYKNQVEFLKSKLLQ